MNSRQDNLETKAVQGAIEPQGYKELANQINTAADEVKRSIDNYNAFMQKEMEVGFFSKLSAKLFEQRPEIDYDSAQLEWKKLAEPLLNPEDNKNIITNAAIQTKTAANIISQSSPALFAEVESLRSSVGESLERIKAAIDKLKNRDRKQDKTASVFVSPQQEINAVNKMLSSLDEADKLFKSACDEYQTKLSLAQTQPAPKSPDPFFSQGTKGYGSTGETPLSDVRRESGKRLGKK